MDEKLTETGEKANQTTVTEQSRTTAPDDDESDWEELDQVLDDFNEPKSAKSPAPTASGPGRPGVSTTAAGDDFDEEAFLKQLETDMLANFMGSGTGVEVDAGAAPSATNDTLAEDLIDKEIKELSKQLEESGIHPDQFFKSFISEAISSTGPKDDENDAASASAQGSFQDTIQRTMERIRESGDRATAAAAEDDEPDAFLEQLLKAAEVGLTAGGDDMNLDKAVMGMMEQLSNKEMLYEPIKELHANFGPWLVENRGKGTVPAEDMVRYEAQAKVVAEVVTKFEDPGYTDKEPEYRTYIWGKMQEMHALGNPPEAILNNPQLGDSGGIPGSAPSECPQQ